jgi:hypothetical protein
MSGADSVASPDSAVDALDIEIDNEIESDYTLIRYAYEV